MFETLSPSLTASSAAVPAIPAARRRPVSFAPLPSLRPLTGRAFLLFAFVYLYSFPYFDRLRSPAELPRILLAQEIVARQTLRLDARAAELGSPAHTFSGVGGHLHAREAPGPSFLAVPVYAVLAFFKATSMKLSTWALRVFAVTVPALLFLPLFYRLTARFTPDEPARRAALVAYALGSSALPSSVLFLAHPLAAFCLGGAFLAAVTLVREETARPRLTALLLGALCGAAPLMDQRTLFVSPLIGLYAFVRGRGRWRNLALIALGAVPFLLALGAYQKALFGSPWNSPLEGASGTGAQGGFLGLVGPSWPAFHGLLFDPGRGLLPLMPWAVLAIVGFGAIVADRAARRRVGAEAVTCLAIVLVYLGVRGSLAPSGAGGSWSVGPAELGAVFPFLGWLAASGLAAAYRRFVTRALAQALVLASAVVFVAAVSTLPHWPEGLASPLHELTFPLVREGYGAHSVGTVLGLKGFWALAPLYLFSLGLALFLVGRGVRRWPLSVALACLLAGGALQAHARYAPRAAPAAEEAWGRITAIWEPPPGPRIPLLATTVAPPPAAPPVPPAAPVPPAVPAAPPLPRAGSVPPAPPPPAKTPPNAGPGQRQRPLQRQRQQRLRPERPRRQGELGAERATE
jgi:hypothetical protein